MIISFGVGSSYNPYKAQFFSSPSDLMKSTVVDESLSTNASKSSVPERNYFMIISCLQLHLFLSSVA